MHASAFRSSLKFKSSSRGAGGIPDDLYVELVNALFKDGWSLAMGCVATSAAALVTAVVTSSLVLYGFSISLPVIAAMRLWLMVAHARGKRDDNIAIVSRWKWRYVVGGSAYIAALGLWTLAVFAITEDGFVRILAFSTT